MSPPSLDCCGSVLWVPAKIHSMFHVLDRQKFLAMLLGYDADIRVHIT